MARRADLVQAVAGQIADTLERGVGIDSSRLLVCPVWADTRWLPLIALLDRLNAGRILCTWAHKRAYDQATVVRAIGRLKIRGVRCHMTFVEFTKADATRKLVREYGGEGALRRPLEEYARKLWFADQCRFLGFQADVAPVLAASDLLIQTSDIEGLPNAVMGAVAAGVPVVATDAGGTRELIDTVARAAV